MRIKEDLFLEPEHVLAVRFNHTTGEPQVKRLRVTLREGKEGKVLDFGHNGVTGYESYYLESLDLSNSNGIWLNVGTRGVYDGLYLHQIAFERIVARAKTRAKRV